MAIGFLLVFTIHAFAKDSKKTAEAMTLDEKISYAIGYSYFENLNKEYKLDIDLFFQGIEDAIANMKVIDAVFESARKKSFIDI